MESTQSTGTAEAGKRPTLLTVLCILSFIAAGFGIIGYLGAIAAVGLVAAAASSLDGAAGAMMATAGPSAGLLWAYIIVGFVTTLIALFGVIKMWKMKKSGFMMYAVGVGAATIMNIITYGFGASIVGIIITGAFIALYGMNLKHMK